MKAKPEKKRAQMNIRVKPAPAQSGLPEAEPEINLVPALLKLKTILVPFDFSEPSRKALKYAESFAEQFGAKITLVFVAEPQVIPADFGFAPMVAEDAELIKASGIKLGAVARDSIHASLFENTLVRTGTPFHEITDQAKTLKADLIIMATHGYTGLKHVLIGSTAERVVRHAPCPVLVVRQTEHEFV